MTEESMQEMLEIVNIELGFEVYRMRRSGDFYTLDRLHPDGTSYILAERHSSKEAIYHYISGMFNVVFMLQQRKAFTKVLNHYI